LIHYTPLGERETPYDGLNTGGRYVLF